MQSSKKYETDTGSNGSRKPRVMPAVVQTKFGLTLGTRAPLPNAATPSPNDAPSKP